MCELIVHFNFFYKKYDLNINTNFHFLKIKNRGPYVYSIFASYIVTRLLFF